LNLLLDTHILLWWLSGSSRLPAAARKAIVESQSTYVSAVTAWEIGIKLAVGKLDFRGDLPDQLARNAFLPLNITIVHAVAAARLPLYHGDPFDRMLVAQASLESLTLVTTDAVLRRYGPCVMVV
jgi:PIN domain nuclease of toxin-antitoxin system